MSNNNNEMMKTAWAFVAPVQQWSLETNQLMGNITSQQKQQQQQQAGLAASDAATMAFADPSMGFSMPSSSSSSSLLTNTTAAGTAIPLPADHDDDTAGRLGFAAISEWARQEQVLSMLTRQQQLQELSSSSSAAAPGQPSSATLQLLLLHQEQQQQQQQQLQQHQLVWLAQQQQAQLLAAQSSVALASSGAVDVNYFSSKDRLQQMLVDQQQLIRALEQEITMAKKAAINDDGSDRSGGSGRRPIAEICFPSIFSSSRCTSIASEAAAATAASSTNIGLQQQPSSVGFGQDSLRTIPAALNGHRVVSEASLLTTHHKAQATAASAVEKKQKACSSLSTSSLVLPSSQEPNATSTPKPKRPLSAYNLFFKDERARMIEEDEDMVTGDDNKDEKTDSGGSAAVTQGCSSGSRKRKKTVASGNDYKEAKRKKIGFAVLAQTIGAKWKSMDEANLQKYRDLADQEKKRYQTELVAYKALQEVEWQKNQKKLEATVDEDTKQRYFANKNKR